ncbi:MAG TPA: hypothetical protein ENN29_05965, partial [Candidatus Hydrogenedentes bacterium]|nr:hypothetical protein [Candidatus Hydrogenedentota bacterium]
MNQNNDNKEYAAANNAALYLVALFVVAIIPFLLHFNLLYAPMQGEEFELFLFDGVMHSPGTAVSSAERFPGSSLGAFTIGLLWWLGGGGMFMLRCAALLALVLTAIWVFYAIRAWLN